jgi:hypothetical protein
VQPRKAAAPEAWIGLQVRVGLVGQQGQAGMEPADEENSIVGTLEEKSDVGLVLRQRTKEGERPVFYPWSSVVWVYATEEEQGAGEERDELQGQLRVLREPPGSQEAGGAPPEREEAPSTPEDLETASSEPQQHRMPYLKTLPSESRQRRLPWWRRWFEG